MPGRRVLASLFLAATCVIALLPASAAAVGPTHSPTPTATATPSPTPTPTRTPTPSPTPSPTPAPSPSPTPPPPTPSPSPTPQGNLILSAASAPASTRLTVQGSGLPANGSFSISIGNQAVGTANTDGGGAFSTDITVPDLAPGGYALCVTEPAGKICAQLTITAAPSPTAVATATPTDTPTAAPPTPSPSTTASATRTAPDRGSPLAFVTQPPFVFFPALLLIGLMGWLAYWLWSLRPGPPIADVVVTHRAAAPRTPAEPDIVIAVTTPAPPPAGPGTEPPDAVVPYESAAPAPHEEPPPAKPDLPVRDDAPPDLPQAIE